MEKRTFRHLTHSCRHTVDYVIYPSVIWATDNAINRKEAKEKLQMTTKQ